MQNADFARFVSEALLPSDDLPLQFDSYSDTNSNAVIVAQPKRASRFSLKRLLVLVRRCPSSLRCSKELIPENFLDFNSYRSETEPSSPTSSISTVESALPLTPVSPQFSAPSVYSRTSTYEPSYASHGTENDEDPFAKEDVQVIRRCHSTRNKSLPIEPSTSSRHHRHSAPLTPPPQAPLPVTPPFSRRRRGHPLEYAPSSWLRSPLKSSPVYSASLSSPSFRKTHRRTSDLSCLFPRPPSSPDLLYMPCSSIPNALWNPGFLPRTPSLFSFSDCEATSSEQSVDEVPDWLDLSPSDSDTDSIEDGAFYTARSSFS